MLKFLQSSKAVQVSEKYRLSVRRQVQEVILSQRQVEPVSPFRRLTDTPRRNFQGWRVP